MLKGTVPSFFNQQKIKRFKHTLSENTNWKNHMLNETWPMAQESVDTLGDFVNLKGNSGQQVKKHNSIALKQDPSWLFIWIFISWDIPVTDRISG
jgi:hypothetical protein